MRFTTRIGLNGRPKVAIWGRDGALGAWNFASFKETSSISALLRTAPHSTDNHHIITVAMMNK